MRGSVGYIRWVQLINEALQLVSEVHLVLKKKKTSIMFVFQIMLGIHCNAKSATDMLNMHELGKRKLGANSFILLHAYVQLYVYQPGSLIWTPYLIILCLRRDVAQEAPLSQQAKKQVL